MKSIIIIGDGMSDWPIARLDGKTPLMAAKKPNIDEIALRGVSGVFHTIAPGQPMGSAVANLAVLGYDPVETYQGRAVLEAASMGVDIAPEDVALRLNLLCVDKEARIKNHSAGHISTAEAGVLLVDLLAALNTPEYPIELHTGVSYRHLLVLKGGWAAPRVKCMPPHDHVGELVSKLLPTAEDAGAETTASQLRTFYSRAKEVLAEHPVNLARRAAGKDEANAIWTWSPGQKPNMKTLQQRFGVNGAVISAVDLVLGLGLLSGMEMIHVEGATGLWDTNYEGKAAAALDAVAAHDLVYVHVEATDEAGHAKDLELKIKCIEMLDARLVGPILRGLEERGIEATIAVLPDHPTPVETGCHADDPVPVAILRPHGEADLVQGYDEVQAKAGSLGVLRGEDFIRAVLGK